MASREQFLQRRDNLCAILGILRQRGAMTRSEVAQALGLSWACVSELTADLLAGGMIIEEKAAEPGGRGRTPTQLRLSGDKWFLGVDVNTMGLTAAVCDLAGRLLRREKFPIHTADAAALLASVTAAVTAMLGPDASRFLGIGLAMQGIARRDGGWDFPGPGGSFRADLSPAVEAEFSLPVLAEHDPNCILFGFEDVALPAAGERGLMMVRVDRGIGVALCRNGRFFDGGALELGHTVISPAGERLQQSASLDGVERQLGRRLAPDPDTGLDAAAQAALAEAGRCLGVALGNLGNLIAVDRIVLCGDLMRYAPQLMPALEAAYTGTVLPSQRAVLAVSALTDAAYGAAKLAAVRWPF